jgi:hypothetical protein
MLYAHTRDHNAITNGYYTNEVYRLRPSMRLDYPQSRAACDHVTLGRQSVRVLQYSYCKTSLVCQVKIY